MLVGLLVLVACGRDPVSDPAGTIGTVTQTSLVAASSPASTGVASTTPATEAVANTAASVATNAPTATPQATDATGTSLPAATSVAPASRIALVFASGGDASAWLPVGWWTGTTWVSAEWPSAETVIPSTTYRRLSVASLDLTDPIRATTDFTRARYSCIDEGPEGSIVYPIDLAPAERWLAYRAVGVLGEWDVQPRAVAVVGLDPPDYQRAGEALVAADGIDPSGGDVTQVVRADLDGDGIEEVLYTFERQIDTTGMGVVGDFSYVIARLPGADGVVRQQVLFRHVVPDPAVVLLPDPQRARVAAVADLNGDGVMEVAIAAVYWESAGITVFELQGGSLEAVMASGCGS